MRLIVVLCFYLFFVPACSPSQTTNQNDSSSEQNDSSPDASPASMQDDRPNNQPPEVMKLTRREIIDKEGTGMVASTFLLPEDWTVEDRLYWDYNDATQPIRVKAKLRSGDGKMAIQIFPNVRATWNTGPSGTWGYPPPRDILTGMKDLIAQERQGISYQITDHKVLSNTNQNTQYGMQYNSSGVVTIEYNDKGQPVEEEFFAYLEIVHLVTPSVMGNMESVVWAAANMQACKAPKGNLEPCKKIAQVVTSSATLTKPFYNRLSQVIKLLSDQVYAQIYQAGQISKIISQTNDQMIANIDASYRQSQQANDRINEQFSDYIRGVDRYDDGGSEVQLPSGYGNAWVNDKGEYLLSSSPGYNPADDFYGNWRQLEKN